MLVVRPDQYVAAVLPLDAHDELTGFLGRILVETTALAPAAGARAG